MYVDEQHPSEHPRIIHEVTYREASRILAGGRRELRLTGLTPDYVLRRLLRYGGCGYAMCPASTSKNGKVYGFYRCSWRDKLGKEACAARPLPAGALQEFVAAYITSATADGTLARHIEQSLRRRIEKQRKARGHPLRPAGGMASASAAAAKLTDELGKRDGHARELVDAKLRVEAERLVAAERQLAETERDLTELKATDAEATSLLGAMRNFANVWGLMTKLKPVRRPAKVAPLLTLAHHLPTGRRRPGARGCSVRRGAQAGPHVGARDAAARLAPARFRSPGRRLGTLEAVDGAERMDERTLRAVADAGTRVEQRAAWSTAPR
ncbi:hypothetical protein BE21_31985 [Sorangium cellulosum]|uniref:Recombinase zinc beta ribbon domain-containing protein n=1 Tax=Sorangium cellulosum TaxID=56 RepID=A0A150TR49_SORCE|nr:hypothetical protein BE21_31985 [Sorangium cellulosum]